MSNWSISKEFDFCYGHRVWSQTLDQEYSLDDKCVCRHLHGHQGKIIVKLESSFLVSGMVTDFKHLNWFKKFLDDVLDHKFIIDKNDPAFNIIVPLTVPWKENHSLGYSIVDPNWFKTLSDKTLIEILEGFVMVDFVPTSENLSKWLFDIVRAKMGQIGIKVESVQFYETPKSSSKYEQ
ncbi:MAG: 6-carboxytetrahydropterin synthase [Clostridia bacterium]|nr:6-carboxytetrahydropterin synthase [Clostridia bacterium]